LGSSSFCSAERGGKVLAGKGNDFWRNIGGVCLCSRVYRVSIVDMRIDIERANNATGNIVKLFVQAISQ